MSERGKEYFLNDSETILCVGPQIVECEVSREDERDPLLTADEASKNDENTPAKSAGYKNDTSYKSGQYFLKILTPETFGN